MTVQIRNARSKDRERCLALLHMLRSSSGGTVPPEAGATFGALLTRERGEVHVAEEDGTVLGMASVTYNLAMRYGGEYCQLEELVVDPEARGKRIGARLVEAVLAAAKRRGIPILSSCWSCSWPYAGHCAARDRWRNVGKIAPLQQWMVLGSPA